MVKEQSQQQAFPLPLCHGERKNTTDVGLLSESQCFYSPYQPKMLLYGLLQTLEHDSPLLALFHSNGQWMFSNIGI